MSTSATCRAFTLIELLAVIAIIALLVSTLVPSLSAARELARQALCLSNLRNIGLMQFSYANEHDGRFIWRCHKALNRLGDNPQRPEYHDPRPMYLAYAEQTHIFYCPSGAREASGLRQGAWYEPHVPMPPDNRRFTNARETDDGIENFYMSYAMLAGYVHGWNGAIMRDLVSGGYYRFPTRNDGPLDDTLAADMTCSFIGEFGGPDDPYWGNHFGRGNVLGGASLYMDIHAEWTPTGRLIAPVTRLFSTKNQYHFW